MSRDALAGSRELVSRDNEKNLKMYKAIRDLKHNADSI